MKAFLQYQFHIIGNELRSRFGRLTGYEINSITNVNEGVVKQLQNKINLREIYTAGILNRLE